MRRSAAEEHIRHQMTLWSSRPSGQVLDEGAPHAALMQYALSLSFVFYEF